MEVALVRTSPKQPGGTYGSVTPDSWRFISANRQDLLDLPPEARINPAHCG